ncbi:MAG: DUF938 domain-containing protein [Sphingomonadales bacterium]
MTNKRDARQYWPSTDRNRKPILEVLKDVLPAGGTVLEVASGSGEHGAYFAPRLAPLYWQPTDIDKDNLASIEAWREEVRYERLLPAKRLDATEDPWWIEAAELAEPVVAIFSANMAHISPLEVTIGLIAGAGRLLGPNGVLVIYGPFMIGGKHTSPSNQAFDQDLRRRNPDWGVRDVDDLNDLAAKHGFSKAEITEMPANNLALVFRK